MRVFLARGEEEQNIYKEEQKIYKEEKKIYKEGIEDLQEEEKKKEEWEDYMWNSMEG